jgi:predicted GNAT family acetyltransferase
LIGGQWVSVLIKDALDQMRADGLKAIAQCPFVNGVYRKNPEYADLVK